MGLQDVSAAVRAAVALRLMLPFDAITDAANLVTDLDASAEDLVDIWDTIETEFGFVATDDDIENAKTVAQVIRAVEALVAPPLPLAA